MKMQQLNELIQRGYNVCFLLDRLVADFMTNAEFEDFRNEILDKFPDPTDTTGTYKEVPLAQPSPVQKEKPCRILRLISKQP